MSTHHQVAQVVTQVLNGFDFGHSERAIAACRISLPSLSINWVISYSWYSLMMATAMGACRTFSYLYVTLQAS
jgi:hypothetical protein